MTEEHENESGVDTVEEGTHQSPDDQDQGENGASITLSKRQQKKLKKRQEWLDTKQERRKKEREKRKLKMAAKKLANDYDESRTASRKSLKQMKMSDSECKVSVVFDMQFSHLMNDRDFGKCLKQITKCYRYTVCY